MKFMLYLIGILTVLFAESIRILGTLCIRLYCWLYGWALTAQFYVAIKRAGLDVKAISVEVILEENKMITPAYSWWKIQEWCQHK